MAHVRVAVLLDRHDWCVFGQPHSWLQTLRRIVAPEAGWNREIVFLIELIRGEISFSVLPDLRAEWLQRAGGVDLESDRYAAWCVAVGTGVDQPNVAQRPSVHDLMLTLTIWTIWARAFACRAWSRHSKWVVVVPKDWEVCACKSWRDVVLPCICFCLIINPVKICMRIFPRGRILCELLEPNADLHMVAEELTLA